MVRLANHRFAVGASLAVALLLSAFCACSPWSVASIDQSLLKPPRMSPDSVVLELAFLDVSEQDELWGEVDEQILPVDLRRKLTQQGLRTGVTGVQLPGWIIDRLEQQKKTIEIDEQTGSAVVGDQDGPRRLQCRSDHPREIDIGPVRKELVLAADATEQQPERTLKDALCRLSVVSQAQGDGRVHLKLTPEIAHGPPRHRWVGGDGSFRIHLSQDHERYDDLTISAVLSPGQTFVLAGTQEVHGLGQHFFPEGERLPNHRRILLLRLAQTQLDDLFNPQPMFTPIATEGQ
ncbi:MAG: hypothetical protein KJ000_02315 [Pirellulaceae bacterium]|nr:hypothetical protein [Pirellulaceae bacterium]